MTAGELVSFAPFDGGSSAVEARGLNVRRPGRRSWGRFWLVVMIEALLLITILGIFWCHGHNESQTAPDPRDITPPPVGNVIAMEVGGYFPFGMVFGRSTAAFDGWRV